jgi:hypothetical protein
VFTVTWLLNLGDTMATTLALLALLGSAQGLRTSPLAWSRRTAVATTTAASVSLFSHKAALADDGLVRRMMTQTAAPPGAFALLRRPPAQPTVRCAADGPLRIFRRHTPS